MRSILIVFGILVGSYTVSAQCNDKLVEKTYEEMEGATYIKDIQVKMPNSNPPKRQKYSMILNKGMTYRFIIANADEYEGELIYKILGQKGIMVVSNYNPVSDKIYNVVEFTCQSTGQYFVEARFKDGKEGCSAINISFKSPFPNWLEKLPTE